MSARHSFFAALWLVLAAPAAIAQEPAGTATAAEVITAEQDLDCALFTSFVLGTMGEKANTQEGAGVIAGLAYFIGRYEAIEGGDIGQAMAARFKSLPAAQFQQLGKQCGARMVAMGQRMQAASAIMAEVEADLAKEAAEAPSQ